MRDLRYQIREIITPQDLDYLAANLREIDKAEIKAFNGMEVREGLEFCLENNDEVWIACVEGVPACIFGLSEATQEDEENTSAVIWALGTDLLFEHKKALNLISRKVIRDWLNRFDVLFNYIWSKNETHIRWVEGMGFTLLPDTYITTDTGEKFILFLQFAPIEMED